MRTIAIINQKGGCGKTTVAINLAAVLAARGRKTLLLDMDPQAHCALGLSVPEAQVDRSIADVLRSGGDGEVCFSDVVWQISRNLDLVPSTMALAGVEAELSGAPQRDRRLSQALSAIGDRYEFAIIDCPPSIGLLTFNALRAAGEVLIPVETGYFSMQGAMRQEATIQMLARRAGHEVRFKVLATMYDVRTRLSREILAELRRHFEDRLLPVVMHFNSKLREAASVGQAITEYDGSSRGMSDFDKLADWLMLNPPSGEQAPASPQKQQQAGTPTALSRAAELAQRARALARRTASLSSRLDRQVGRQSEGGRRSAAGAGGAGRNAVGAGADDSDNRGVDAPVHGQASHGGDGRGSEVAPLRPMAKLPRPVGSALVHEPEAKVAAGAGEAGNGSRLQRVFGVRQTPQGLLFIQPADRGYDRICIAGDFNDWSPHATPMTLDPALGIWQALVPITAAGRYRYRLVVDGQWVTDPHNRHTEKLASGEVYSVVEAGDVAAQIGGAP